MTSHTLTNISMFSDGGGMDLENVQTSLFIRQRNLCREMNQNEAFDSTGKV